jgi:beta-galactosidase
VLRAGGLVAGAGLLAACDGSPGSPDSPPPAGPGVGPGAAPPAARQQIGLNTGWRFLDADLPGAQRPELDDRAWAKVTVPHTWNALDGQDGGGNYRRGAGWYRRHFAAPSALAGRKLWLQFDGANQVADVWVNGVSLGQHRGGYARFRFDATAALRPGQDNLIAVRVDNSADPMVAPLGADYTFFGGIYRPVCLLVTDPLSIDLMDFGGPGVYLRQQALTADSATVEVASNLRNNGSALRRFAVRVVVSDAAGRVVADATAPPRDLLAGFGAEVVQPVHIARPRRWQGRADPYLYRVDVEVHDAATGTVTDAVTQPLGLRTVGADPDEGVFLNGRHLPLHGVSRHQDRLGRGWAIGDAEHRQDFDLMDEMGVNALRTAHYQQDQTVYELADERGYLVWTEIPLVGSVTDTPAFADNAERQLRELIRQNYNHPSIAFWGIGNEQSADDGPTNALLAKLAAVAVGEDPGRLSGYAHNGPAGSGLTNHTKVVGYNRYCGWYGNGSYQDFGGYVDGLHDGQPSRLIVITEYGAGASVGQHEENPAKPVTTSPWHPEEYQALLHESHWAQISRRPFLLGTFLWNMFDFASDGRAEGDSPGRNDKGLVTYDRQTRKDAFYWYKANWTSTPFVYITSRRWTARTAPTTTVKVYATTDTVELTVNGVHIGPPQTSADHIFRWPGVTLAPGANTVEAVGTRKGATYRDSVTWTLG